jgi:SPP1 family predicted phage head-tail adaptor
MAQQLNGGSLDRRITIQRMTVAVSAYNEPLETWVKLYGLWAKKLDTSAGEARAAAEVGASLSARFTVRWSTQAAGITPKDRVVYDGKTYNITAVRATLQRNTFIEIDTVVRADK